MMLVWKWIAVSLCLMNGEVTTLSGDSSAGSIVNVSADRVDVRTDDGKVTSVPLSDVLEIMFADHASVVPAASETDLLLFDGTQISWSDLNAGAETVTADTKNLGRLELPRSAVRSVLLKTLPEEWRGQWAAFLKRHNSKDMLIIEKRDN
ncbi:MAG: hypothetical protein KDA89_17690 [Planctomycetaceae bacterium]|nr:hypothetical protein [Planctomycetaceae bacterium]